MGVREIDAMQYILDLLTDGIITSAVQQIGHTPHDKVSESELPFVQVYSPINENQDQDLRQDPGVLTLPVIRAGTMRRFITANIAAGAT